MIFFVKVGKGNKSVNKYPFLLEKMLISYNKAMGYFISLFYLEKTHLYPKIVVVFLSLLIDFFSEVYTP